MIKIMPVLTVGKKIDTKIQKSEAFNLPVEDMLIMPMKILSCRPKTLQC